VKYLLLVYDDPANWTDISEEQMAGLRTEYEAVSKDPATVGGAQLKPVDTAKTVRINNGSTLTTDGPFAETKEQLGGYFLIEAKDLNDALHVASRVPGARFGSVEVRPVMEVPQRVG
jgi:hypothetical protein